MGIFTFFFNLTKISLVQIHFSQLGWCIGVLLGFPVIQPPCWTWSAKHYMRICLLYARYRRICPLYVYMSAIHGTYPQVGGAHPHMAWVSKQCQVLIAEWYTHVYYTGGLRRKAWRALKHTMSFQGASQHIYTQCFIYFVETDILVCVFICL